MLNSNLLRTQDAFLHFEVMAYLIQNFGQPLRPALPARSSLLKGFETLAWSELDSRSVYHWAEDYFGVLISLCDINKDDVCLVAAEEDLDVNRIAEKRRLDMLASGQIPNYGQTLTSIIYDPRDCIEPGHFIATICLQLAEFRSAGFTSDKPLSTLMKRMVTLITAAYLGQGLLLSHLPRQVSAYLTPPNDRRAVSQKTLTQALCFSTCLALHVNQFSETQIIEAYRGDMPKTFQRKIHQACRQIDSHSEALSVLKLLAETKYQPISLAKRSA